MLGTEKEQGERVLLFTESEYRSMRESYCYYDRDCRFQVIAATGLDDQFTGNFLGIFPKRVPPYCAHGINLRRFEAITQAVFAAASRSEANGTVPLDHVKNLKEIANAIVHWKMASQGGRADLKAKNVRNKWGDDTAKILIDAYRRKKMELFEIGGVRIPTATAFLRFLFPDEYGIMDSRVARITQKHGITSLDIREDGYINDTRRNKEQYANSYNPFLLNEASQLKSRGVLFQDVDENGNLIDSPFRPCDIEMALFKDSAQQIDGAASLKSRLIMSLDREERRMTTPRDFGGHRFNFFGVIKPALDGVGGIAEYTHALPSEVRPNRYARGPFCRFKVNVSVNGAPTGSGVYAITAADELKYIGECEDLMARFGANGYGAIAARNCYSDGQATNCKVNSLVLSVAKSGQVIGVWFLETAKRKAVEAELLAVLDPPWNGAKPRRQAVDVVAPRTIKSKSAAPTADDFRSALKQEFAKAVAAGQPKVLIRAGDLHHKVGGYPGGNHRMPACCQIMKAAIQSGDKVVEIPPRGAGANLIVEYVLPRPA